LKNKLMQLKENLFNLKDKFINKDLMWIYPMPWDIKEKKYIKINRL